MTGVEPVFRSQIAEWTDAGKKAWRSCRELPDAPRKTRHGNPLDDFADSVSFREREPIGLSDIEFRGRKKLHEGENMQRRVSTHPRFDGNPSSLRC